MPEVSEEIVVAVSRFPGTHLLHPPRFGVSGHNRHAVVFVQRQVPRVVQVLQNWGSAAARFRTKCVRVLRRGAVLRRHRRWARRGVASGVSGSERQKRGGVGVAVHSQLSTSPW